MLGGVPDPSDQQRVIITKDGLGELARDRELLVAWINAAHDCLTGGAP